MRITGTRAEVTITKDEYGHRLEIVRGKDARYLRFGEHDSEAVAIDIARIFAGTSDLYPETVAYLWDKLG